MGKSMKPHEQCKQAGLKSLAELSELTGVKTRTLINWHKNRPLLFNAIIRGTSCAKKEKGQSHQPTGKVQKP